MKNVLVVKANNRPDGVSTKMYEAFVDAVAKHSELKVTIYDLYNEELPYFGQDLINALGKLQKGEELTDRESRLIAEKQKAQDAFVAADVLVFAFPMWNMTIPAVLHTFIDYVFTAGFTFKYNADGSLAQPMKDKKVVLLNARGGFYSTPETAGMEMSVNYMHNIFAGIFGMEIIEEVVIEGHNEKTNQAVEIIEAGLKKVAEVPGKLLRQFA